MKVSVIVCTYNRCDELRGTLTSLAASQVQNSFEWDVLVVDNNSTDQTRVVVEELSRTYPGRFRYIFEPIQGKSWALNRGIREASGAILAFTDDDVKVDPSWLENISAPLRDERYAGSGGRTLGPAGFTPPRWLAVDRPHSLAPLALFDRGFVPMDLEEPPYGNNMAYRKEVFERHGGFRTDLGPRPGMNCPQKSEDCEFGMRLLAAGERLRYVPSAVVYHSVPPHRLERKYFLSWSWDKAQSDFYIGESPVSMKMKIGGVSFVLFRRLARWTLEWLISIEPSRRFDCKMKVWSLAGTIQAARQLNYKHSSQH
jgi:glycosyltransferase involved in cell wall biosynthesis